MYNKVLVPLDGSALAECVLSHLEAVAKGCGVSEVDLIFVVNPIRQIPYDQDGEIVPITGIRAEQQDKEEAWGKNYLAKIVKLLKGDGITAKPVVVRGNPSDHILDYAAKNGIDLIVMSTHGRSGPARWALGSVADRVVRLATMPVLVVRHPSCVVGI